MISKRIGGICAAIGLSLGLGACTDGYGYSGVSLGYGNAGYYGDPYYDDFGYAGFGGFGGYGVGQSWFGWNNGFYYPGTGVYVYDSYRRPYRWNNAQQRYWSGQQRFRGRDWNGQGNWGGFDRRDWQARGATRGEVRENYRDYRQDRRADTRAFRQDRQVDRQAFRQGQVTPQQFRQERRDDRRTFNRELRQDGRALRRENRRDARD